MSLSGTIPATTKLKPSRLDTINETRSTVPLFLMSGSTSKTTPTFGASARYKALRADCRARRAQFWAGLGLTFGSLLLFELAPPVAFVMFCYGIWQQSASGAD